jgi:hypothetical protein
VLRARVIVTAAAVTAVASMHEEMDEWTEQQESVWERAEEVRPVLFPEEDHGDRRE